MKLLTCFRLFNLMRKGIRHPLIPYLLISVISFAIFYAIASTTAIRKIEVEGADDIRGLDAYFARNILLVSEKDIKENIMKQNPTLTDITVFKDFPDTLYITARSLRPVAILKLTDGAAYISQDGTVLRKEKTPQDVSLPGITYYQPQYYNQFSIGKKVDNEDVEAAVLFADRMLELGLAVSSIDITNENMIVLHTKTFSVFITSVKDAAQQYEEFSYSYKQLKLTGKQFSRIDVRFDKPIIQVE